LEAWSAQDWASPCIENSRWRAGRKRRCVLDESRSIQIETPGEISRRDQRKKERLSEYQVRFHHDQKVDFCGKNVLVVDDGLATGATMKQQCCRLRKQGAQKVIVAVPMAQGAQFCDWSVSLIGFSCHQRPGFEAVRRYYDPFLK